MTQGLHVRAMRPSLLSSLTPRHAISLSSIHHSSHIPQQPTLCTLCPPSIQHHGLNVPRCVVGSLSLANSNGSTPPLSQSPTHTTLPTPYYYAAHTTRIPPFCIIATTSTSNEITHNRHPSSHAPASPSLLHQTQIRCNSTSSWQCGHHIAMTQGMHVRAMRPSLLSSLTPRHATPFPSSPSIIEGHHTKGSSDLRVCYLRILVYWSECNIGNHAPLLAFLSHATPRNAISLSSIHHSSHIPTLWHFLPSSTTV